MSTKNTIFLYDPPESLLMTKVIITNRNRKKKKKILYLSGLKGIEKLAMDSKFIEYINSHRGERFEIEIQHFKILNKTMDNDARCPTNKEIELIVDHLEWYSHRLQRILDGNLRKFLITVG